MGGGLKMRSEKMVVNAFDSTPLLIVRNLPLNLTWLNDPYYRFLNPTPITPPPPKLKYNILPFRPSENKRSTPDFYLYLI